MLNTLLFELIAYYLRNSSMERGRYRLLKLARPIGRDIGRELGIRRVITKSGFTMELDLSDWIPQDIYLTGEFEEATSSIARALLKSGDTAVDVGANIGYFSLLFAQCVGDTGRVISYEPVPVLAAKLRRNLELNRFDNTAVRDLALSDRSGAARFYVGPRNNTGLSSLRSPRESSDSFEVQLAPFDGLVEDCAKVTLVKIDVEGAELQVLRGMEGLLRTMRPNLLVEVTDSFLREMGDSAASLLQYVRQLGYVGYVIGDGRLTLLEKWQGELPKQWNALFAPSHLFGAGVAFDRSGRPRPASAR